MALGGPDREFTVGGVLEEDIAGMERWIADLHDPESIIPEDVAKRAVDMASQRISDAKHALEYSPDDWLNQSTKTSGL